MKAWGQVLKYKHLLNNFTRFAKYLYVRGRTEPQFTCKKVIFQDLTPISLPLIFQHQQPEFDGNHTS